MSSKLEAKLAVVENQRNTFLSQLADLNADLIVMHDEMAQKDAKIDELLAKIGDLESDLEEEMKAVDACEHQSESSLNKSEVGF